MNRHCVTHTWEADGTKWRVLIRDVLEEEKPVVFLGSEKEQRDSRRNQRIRVRSTYALWSHQRL